MFIFTDQISSSLGFARYTNRLTTRRLTFQWNQKLNSCVLTARCVLADRAEIANYFYLDIFALNRIDKSFRGNYRCFHTELKSTWVKSSSLKCPQMSEPSTPKWKHHLHLRSVK